MFYLLETQVEYFHFDLWTIAGYILGDVPTQYEFLQVFVCIVLIFMLCIFIYSPVLILKGWLDRR